MFALNPGSGIPIYRQLEDQIKRLIGSGRLQPGDTLPSVRALAVAHAVNPMTVSKAYNRLEAEGVLCRRRGRPMAVAPNQSASDNPARLLADPLAALVEAGRQLQLSDRQIKAALKDYLDDPNV